MRKIAVIVIVLPSSNPLTFAWSVSPFKRQFWKVVKSLLSDIVQSLKLTGQEDNAALASQISR